MHTCLTSAAGGVFVESHARNPGQPVTGKNQRPAVTVLARHSRVHEDVLELARASPADRSHAKARRAIAQAQLQTRS